jgi:TRAP-type C4-dicarboxylate transport system permease small subunit
LIVIAQVGLSEGRKFVSDIPDLAAACRDGAHPRCARLEAAVAGACMAGMTAIVFANVVVRYLTNASLAFTEEFAIFLMVAMTLFGASSAAAHNHHIRINVVVDRLGPALRRIVDLAVDIGSAGTFAVLAVLAGFYTYDIWRFGDVSPAMGFPLWAYWIWVPLLCAAIALRIVGQARRRRGAEGGGHGA